MPVGNQNSSSKSKKKDEVSQKVQEIKQRQQNWLKQREQSKQEDSSSKPKVSQPSSSKPGPSTISSFKQNGKGSSYVITKKTANSAERTKPAIQDRFHHWINARNTGNEYTDETDFNDCNSIRSGAESELERLVSPDFDTARQPVLEEDFGSLADKIANRVKEDMGLSQSVSATSASTDITLVENEQPVWDSARCRTFTQEVPTFNHLGTSGLTSHSCVVCKKLMLSSKHIPMMVIPCGHTLCKSCSDGRQTCPSCDCPVVSLTVNIMLQQVIQEYHAHPVPSTYVTNSSDSGSKVEAGSKQTTSSHYVEDNRRNRMASYKTQLANLQTRHDVLSTEHKTLLNRQKQINTQMHQDQTQAQSIKKQEEEIEKTILDLQERLSALREHRQHYESQVMELQDEKSEVEGKISLLTSTVTSLVREIEKIKLLAEGENEVPTT